MRLSVHGYVRLVMLVFLITLLGVFWISRNQVAEDSVGPVARSETLLKHINDTCEAFRFSGVEMKTDPVLKHMHYDDTRKVIYCYIPKVACTSWKRVWMKMTGKLTPEVNENAQARELVHTSLPLLAKSNDKEEKLRTYKKFMVVRHPFDRVLSAYRDKLENEDKHSFYDFHKKVGQQIEKKYRGNTEKKGDNVTFSEYIRFISEPGSGTGEQRNEHWQPMYQLCDPCSVQYDFIGKYENLKEDANYLLKWIGAKDLVSEFPVSDRPFNTSRYTQEYWGKLSHREITAFHSKVAVTCGDLRSGSRREAGVQNVTSLWLSWWWCSLVDCCKPSNNGFPRQPFI